MRSRAQLRTTLARAKQEGPAAIFARHGLTPQIVETISEESMEQKPLKDAPESIAIGFGITLGLVLAEGAPDEAKLAAIRDAIERPASYTEQIRNWPQGDGISGRAIEPQSYWQARAVLEAIR